MKEMEEDEEIRILGGAHWKEDREGKTGHGSAADQYSHRKARWSRKRWFLTGGVLLVVLFLLAYKLYVEPRMYGFEYPVTREQEEVIASMLNAPQQRVKGVSYDSDTYLGVTLKLYKIEGLEAELCDSFPPCDDRDVYLITRSSDYRFEGEEKVTIGDYVRKGQQLSRSNWRAGYMAIVNGQAEIGIGRDRVMRKYVTDHQGSMFRQFALVSAGVKCISQYVLKGKVTRCAYARTPNNELYFVESADPETLYGFADALIEYGFVDAIYVTGGKQPALFYRDTEGIRHGDYVDDKAHRMVVWRSR